MLWLDTYSVTLQSWPLLSSNFFGSTVNILSDNYLSNYLRVATLPDLGLTPDYIDLSNRLFRTSLTSNVTPEVTKLPNPEMAFLADLPIEYKHLELQLRRYQRFYPHLTLEQIFNRMDDLGSDGLEMALKLIEHEDNPNRKYLERFTHNGKEVVVSELTSADVFNLLDSVDDIDQYETLAHVRTTYMSTTPNIKLYYPEPFIASPSMIHNDLGFIHILQYQY